MRVFAAVAALALLAGPAVAQTGPAAQHTFSAIYNVHARGMNAGEATYNFTFNGATYEGASTRRMTGLARTLLGDSQDYTYNVRGQLGPGGQVRPVAYEHRGGRRNRVVQVAFQPDNVVTTANPVMGMGSPPATAAQKLGSVDQVSMFAQMILAQGDPCRQTIKVFLDGRARFDLVMSPSGRENVRVGDFRGQGWRCSVQYRPIAGFSEPQEPGVFTFLFAQAPNGMYAPVRIEIPTDDAGTVRLEARSFTAR